MFMNRITSRSNKRDSTSLPPGIVSPPKKCKTFAEHCSNTNDDVNDNRKSLVPPRKQKENMSLISSDPSNQKFTFLKSLNPKEKLLAIIEWVNNIPGSINTLGMKLIECLFGSDKELGVLLNIWACVDESFARSQQDYMIDLFNIVNSVAVMPIKIRVDLIANDDDDDDERRGRNKSVSGKLHIFSSSQLSIPIAVLSENAKAILTAICYSKHASFQSVSTDNVTNSINYSSYLYDNDINGVFNRNKVLNDIIRIIVRAHVSKFCQIQTMLLSVMSNVPARYREKIHENYLKLERMQLEEILNMNNVDKPEKKDKSKIDVDIDTVD